MKNFTVALGLFVSFVMAFMPVIMLIALNNDDDLNEQQHIMLFATAFAMAILGMVLLTEITKSRK